MRKRFLEPRRRRIERPMFSDVFEPDLIIHVFALQRYFVCSQVSQVTNCLKLLISVSGQTRTSHTLDFDGDHLQRN